MRTLKKNDKVRVIHPEQLITWDETLVYHHAKHGDIGTIKDADANYDTLLVQFENDTLIYEVHELLLEKISNTEDFILNKE